jgi:ABC-type multidrug transport system fused ATPase/permease subunit
MADLVKKVLGFSVKTATFFLPTTWAAKIIDGYLSMPRIVRALALTFLGTLWPFSVLWFLHMLLGLIFGSIVYAFFTNKGGQQFFYAFLIGVAITAVIMTVFYLLLNTLFEGTLRDVSNMLQAKIGSMAPSALMETLKGGRRRRKSKKSGSRKSKKSGSRKIKKTKKSKRRTSRKRRASNK